MGVQAVMSNSAMQYLGVKRFFEISSRFGNVVIEHNFIHLYHSNFQYCYCLLGWDYFCTRDMARLLKVLGFCLRNGTTANICQENNCRAAATLPDQHLAKIPDVRTH